jgi:DnaK suppressor protein
VSKPPAKAAAASKTKPAAKAPAKSATATKPTPQPAVKPVVKPAAKPAAPAKAASPAAPKAAAPKAAAPKAPAKPAAKAPEKTPEKPAAKAPAQAADKPAVKPDAKAAAAAPAAAPTPPAPPAKAPAKPAGRSAKAAAPLGAKDIPPADSPVPGARHGFAERFGPAATTSYRQMPDTAEMPKAAPKDPKLVNAWKTKAGRELTDAELLAMPESEYMNDKQLDFFRARLEQQKADLLSSAGETTEHLREDTSIVPDPVDRATIEEEHALELRTRDRERKLLKKIAQALARLDNGDYGYCDETGEPIGLQRLMARPTATLSLEAQQRREMKQRMFGD